jgi:GntR family transcriptional regulator
MERGARVGESRRTGAGLAAPTSLPAYRHVVNDLRALILSGELSPGARLPSVREIAERYSVPTGTAVRAVAELRAEGHVISRQGSGVYVRPFLAIPRSSPSRLARDRWAAGRSIQERDTGTRPRTADIEVGETPARDWVAGPLGMQTGAPVAYRRRRFVIGGRLVQMATSYLPVELARGTPIMHTNPGPGGMYARLAELGHEPEVFTEYLRARMPYPDERKRLELPDGTPIIEITRHAFQADGRCVEVNRMILDATAYVLDYTFTNAGPVPTPATNGAECA